MENISLKKIAFATLLSGLCLAQNLKSHKVDIPQKNKIIQNKMPMNNKIGQTPITPQHVNVKGNTKEINTKPVDKSLLMNKPGQMQNTKEIDQVLTKPLLMNKPGQIQNTKEIDQVLTKPLLFENQFQGNTKELQLHNIIFGHQQLMPGGQFQIQYQTQQECNSEDSNSKLTKLFQQKLQKQHQTIIQLQKQLQQQAQKQKQFAQLLKQQQHQMQHVKNSQLLSKQIKLCPILPVSSGFPVSYQSIWPNSPSNLNFDHGRYQIDSEQAWSALKNVNTTWIQIFSQDQMQWEGLTLQGRKNHPQWVTKIRVSYSSDGQNWAFVDDGKVFDANYDQNTKVPINFSSPVTARTVRIHPVEWFGHVSLRFEANAKINC